MPPKKSILEKIENKFPADMGVAPIEELPMPEFIKELEERAGQAEYKVHRLREALDEALKYVNPDVRVGIMRKLTDLK